MTQTIEPGFYMVEVLSGVLKKDPSLAVIKCRDDTGGFYYADQGPAQFISKSCLLPLPEPDKLTELEREFVETSVAWKKEKWGNSEYIKARERSIDATDALIAFREDQNPKSPIEELRAAIEDLRADPGEEAYQRVQDALKKVEGK